MMYSKENFLSKKILILFGSANKKGSTSKMLCKFLNKFKNPTIKFVSAYEKRVEPCIGCDFCKENLKCIFRDMDDIYEFLKESDVIIFAFPIYNFSFPAPLKAIFDRFQIYYNAKVFHKINLLENKMRKCFVLTVQDSKEDITEILRAQTEHTIKLLGVSNIIYDNRRNTDF
ncbi:MAG: flavodoxin family protein [Clostridia bacterium]|nr:flavodoxin family protein [Clostridia bacterium]